MFFANLGAFRSSANFSAFPGQCRVFVEVSVKLGITIGSLGQSRVMNLFTDMEVSRFSYFRAFFLPDTINIK